MKTIYGVNLLMIMNEEGNENDLEAIKPEAPKGAPSLYNIATSIVNMVKRIW
tara:strand:- start:90 stop:245 length:156 start_codon:yes stop_codon:yes gene_type:complete